MTTFHAFTLGYLARINQISVQGHGLDNIFTMSPGVIHKLGNNVLLKRVRVHRSEDRDTFHKWQAVGKCRLPSLSAASIFGDDASSGDNTKLIPTTHEVPIHFVLATYLLENAAGGAPNRCPLKENADSLFVVANLGPATLKDILGPTPAVDGGEGGPPEDGGAAAVVLNTVKTAVLKAAIDVHAAAKQHLLTSVGVHVKVGGAARAETPLSVKPTTGGAAVGAAAAKPTRGKSGLAKDAQGALNGAVKGSLKGTATRT